ncbi:MAG: ABC transporter permease [Lachnospiraceae bacterium]|nr:ABC transporter permease [Lachnospiraceae bacterium]
MNESVNPSVRVQKVKKSRIKIKLFVFVTAAVLLLLSAVFAQQLCPFDPYEMDLSIANLKPGADHIMGTDQYGRDLFSRILMGGRTSIFSTLTLVAIISVSGTIVGVTCGFSGGFFDTFVMRISDICLAFPGLVFALAVAALLKGGVAGAVIALAVISWPKYARIARSQTLAQMNTAYIHAAKLSGSSSVQIILRHILPNTMGPVLVTAMLDIGTMMMELAGLSFLGLGAQPPTAEWGSMMSAGRSMLQIYPWQILCPGFAIFVTVIIFNLLGDTIRDFMDIDSNRS